MNSLDFSSLPLKIKNRIDGLDYYKDTTGKSGAEVYIFDEYVLKISSLSFDIENEIKVSKLLKGKLPIAELVDSEIVENKVYLLKRKIIGKPLCSEEYMTNPPLLFKLASQALKLLWSVDISSLDLQDTYKTIIDFGKKAYQNNLIDFTNCDKNVVEGFSSFDDIFTYLDKNKPPKDNVLCHGDLCLTNIICKGDKIKGFIDLGLMGIDNRYHDIAILYRSIKYNFLGYYGKSYQGFDDDLLFKNLNLQKDEEKIRYYLLLDEVLG